MKKIVRLLTICLSMSAYAQDWLPIIELFPASINENDVFSVKMAIDDDILLVDSPNHDFNESGTGFISEAGAVYVFQRDAEGNWTERQKLVASDRLAGNKFGGSALAISGDYAVISPERHNFDASGQNFLSNSGAVYVFERDSNGNFNEVQILVASDRKNNAHFGWSVDIEDSTILVGAYRERADVNDGNELTNAGAVYVFERNDSGVWNEIQKIVSPFRTQQEQFGSSVALDGITAIIGSDSDMEDALEQNPIAEAGSAHAFVRDISGVWMSTQKLVPADRSIGDKFGRTVALDDGRAVFGVYLQDENVQNDDIMENAGAAYVFEKNVDGLWMETQKLVASDRQPNDHYGWSVTISGERLVVGSYLEDNDNPNPLFDTGAIYAYHRGDDGVWGDEQLIRHPQAESDDEFGTAVTMDQNRLVAGTRLRVYTDGTTVLGNAGSAYVFEIDENLGLVENYFDKVRIYPNPARDKLTIDFGIIEQDVKVKVTNSMGQLILEENRISSQRLDLSIVGADGLYFVNVITGNGVVKTFKIVRKQ